LSHASGISIIIACGSDRPESSRNSSALSIWLESEAPSRVIGKTFGRSSPNRLPGAHPVAVSAQRVDLAVVAERSERLSEIPGRPGIRAVALVHERQRAHEALVAQVGVERLDLGREQEPLVDDRARREAAGEEVVVVLLVPEPLLELLPDHEELALERVVVRDHPGAPDEDLADHRHGAPRQLADVLGVDGHVAPAEQLLPLVADHPLDRLLAALTALRVLREEEHADAVVAGVAHGDSDLAAGRVHE
jgi:hypothetical protein